ncbi:hypothetical protein BB561_004296 [Smittium simulii]|uniref:C2H2-type domain-containing protein n=1 Tax=Smittium simulii TaxID=133385 RepID=A0A2T9YH75_9FUNG|nr:hypothetical protein BB561_004296 [Smittium simulii]
MISCNKTELTNGSENDSVSLDLKSILDFENILKDQFNFDLYKPKYFDILQQGNFQSNENNQDCLKDSSLALTKNEITNIGEVVSNNQEIPPIATDELHSNKISCAHEKNESAKPKTITATASEKPVQKYNCQYCDKSFTRPSSLTIHTYTHTGEKPHECTFPGCKKRFSVLSNLRRHLKLHKKKQYIQLHNSPYSSRIVPGISRKVNWDLNSQQFFLNHKQINKNQNPYILPKNINQDMDFANIKSYDYKANSVDFSPFNEPDKYSSVLLDQHNQEYYNQERQDARINKNFLSSSYITNINKVPARMDYSVSEGYLYPTENFGNIGSKLELNRDYFSLEASKNSLDKNRDNISNKLIYNYQQSLNNIFSPNTTYGLNVNSRSEANNVDINLDINSESNPLGLDLLNRNFNIDIQMHQQQSKEQALFLHNSRLYNNNNTQIFNQSPNINYIDILSKDQFGLPSNAQVDSSTKNNVDYRDYANGMQSFNRSQGFEKEYNNPQIIDKLGNFKSIDASFDNQALINNTNSSHTFNSYISSDLNSFSSFTQKNPDQATNSQWANAQKELKNSYYLSKIYSSQL